MKREDAARNGGVHSRNPQSSSRDAASLGNLEGKSREYGDGEFCVTLGGRMVASFIMETRDVEIIHAISRQREAVSEGDIRGRFEELRR